MINSQPSRTSSSAPIGGWWISCHRHVARLPQLGLLASCLLLSPGTLAADDKASRPRISIEKLTPDESAALSLDKETGLRLEGFHEGTWPALSGLKPGDVLTAIQVGERKLPLTSTQPLQRAVNIATTQKVDIVVLREGKTLTVTLKVAAPKPEAAKTTPAEKDEPQQEKPPQTLTEQEKVSNEIRRIQRHNRELQQVIEAEMAARAAVMNANRQAQQPSTTEMKQRIDEAVQSARQEAEVAHAKAMAEAKKSADSIHERASRSEEQTSIQARSSIVNGREDAFLIVMVNGKVKGVTVSRSTIEPRNGEPHEQIWQVGADQMNQLPEDLADKVRELLKENGISADVKREIPTVETKMLKASPEKQAARKEGEQKKERAPRETSKKEVTPENAREQELIKVIRKLNARVDELSRRLEKLEAAPIP
ncbi:MAG: hypothetical protein C0478_03860 [Planctomyces sp.]|nr:hypothetical protein [Planctomyces sp.]